MVPLRFLPSLSAVGSGLMVISAFLKSGRVPTLLPMRFVCGRPDCHAAAELKPWNEEGKVWNEEPEGEGTYRPFEGLDEMMESREH